MVKHVTDQQLDLYLDDGLAEGERARIDQHMRTCVECRSRLESMRSLFDSLGALAVAVPVGLEAEVTSAVADVLAPESDEQAGSVWAAHFVLSLLSLWILVALSSRQPMLSGLAWLRQAAGSAVARSDAWLSGLGHVAGSVAAELSRGAAAVEVAARRLGGWLAGFDGAIGLSLSNLRSALSAATVQRAAVDKLTLSLAGLHKALGMPAGVQSATAGLLSAPAEWWAAASGWLRTLDLAAVRFASFWPPAVNEITPSSSVPAAWQIALALVAITLGWVVSNSVLLRGAARNGALASLEVD